MLLPQDSSQVHARQLCLSMLSSFLTLLISIILHHTRALLCFKYLCAFLLSSFPHKPHLLFLLLRFLQQLNAYFFLKHLHLPIARRLKKRMLARPLSFSLSQMVTIGWCGPVGSLIWFG